MEEEEGDGFLEKAETVSWLKRRRFPLWDRDTFRYGLESVSALHMKDDRLKKLISSALEEDIGRIDLTTTFLVPAKIKASAHIIAKSRGIVAGLPVVETVFSALDNTIAFKPNARDGNAVEKGKVVCYLEGPAASILMGERVALNFLGHLSGIATKTRAFVDKVKNYKVDIMDTRKTTPNMRFLERYAVKTGGGKNHREGLYDQVLIKENHLQAFLHSAAGSKAKSENHASIVADAVRAARHRAQKNTVIEAEVKSIAEFEAALSADPDIILLDNMSPKDIEDAVKIKKAAGSKAQKVKLEASGGITLANVAAYAATGVDRISIGGITHSAESADFSLELL